MTQISAGNLRNRVTLQRQVKQVDTRGASVGWDDTYTRWASVMMLRGSELEIQRKTFAKATTKIIMRRPSGFDFGATWRVCYRGQVYAINYVGITGEKQEDLELICESVNVRV
jgi:SPP1 family predicted phage head-tail adaptor